MIFVFLECIASAFSRDDAQSADERGVVFVFLEVHFQKISIGPPLDGSEVLVRPSEIALLSRVEYLKSR